IVDLEWESHFQPVWERMLPDHLAHAANRRVFARLFRQGRPAPTLVCLHGYRGGAFAVEERAFPVRWLHGLGLNVVLFTLPFHARRGDGGRPIWPSANVGRTNEGFAQAVYDLRVLVGWLKEAHPDVAVTGMSLGGYTTA